MAKVKRNNKKVRRNNNDEKNLTFIHNTINIQLERQLETINALDTKASFVLIFVGSVITATSLIRPGSLELDLLSIGLIVIFISACFSLAVLYPRVYYVPPKPSAFYNEQIKTSHIETVKQQTSNLVAAYGKNEIPLEKKCRWLNLSFLSLLIGILIILLNKVDFYSLYPLWAKIKTNQ